MSAHTQFSVNKEDLIEARRAAEKEANGILEQVNTVQTRLANTTYIGENAEQLAEEMNQTMRPFVDATYENLDELMRVITNNMNVVVTKLGGAAWEPYNVARGTVSEAASVSASGNTDYQIETTEMEAFAEEVDASFAEIEAGYTRLQATIEIGTPSWRGPEKDATVGAMAEAIPTILGSEGGGGVRGVGSSLSTALRSQVTLMTG